MKRFDLSQREFLNIFKELESHQSASIKYFKLKPKANLRCSKI